MDASFPIGSSVVLQNLINGATYNRLRGIVKSDLDPTSLRQNVFIITANKTIAIRPTNMKHCVPTENYDDVLFMSIKELKEELQSYNISTESYFDKTSLVDAVTMARRERWRQPVTVSVGISAAGAQSEHERTSTAANNGSNDGRDGKASSAAAASDTTSFSNGYQSKKRTAADDSKSSKKKKANELPTEVALAKTWNENTSVTGYYMSEKLDGMRCIWDGKVGHYRLRGLSAAHFIRTDSFLLLHFAFCSIHLHRVISTVGMGISFVPHYSLPALYQLVLFLMGSCF